MAALRCMKCAAGVSSGVSKCNPHDHNLQAIAYRLVGNAILHLKRSKEYAGRPETSHEPHCNHLSPVGCHMMLQCLLRDPSTCEPCLCLKPS